MPMWANIAEIARKALLTSPHPIYGDLKAYKGKGRKYSSILSSMTTKERLEYYMVMYERARIETPMNHKVLKRMKRIATRIHYLNACLKQSVTIHESGIDDEIPF